MLVALAIGCGSGSGNRNGDGHEAGSGSDSVSDSGSESEPESDTGSGSDSGSGSESASPPAFADGPPAGNPDGACAVPADARAEDVSHPDHVIGTGTADSCSGQSFVDAVALGGVITFDCGDAPLTITVPETAKVHNDGAPKTVIDGGGKVTLSGGGKRRILYQNTCDQSLTWTTSHCDDQELPQLTVQNITFEGGNAKGLDPDGGGAIYARGGQLKVVGARFFHNVCDDVGPDVGGAAIRALQQYHGLPVYIVNSTFGGSEELGNVCSNGGGLSSIGVSFTVINSAFSYNRAIGNGANPMKDGTPGGGSGGAIYNDGNTFTLSLCGTLIEHNHANEGGGAIFYVSNDRSGTLEIKDSILRDNPSDAFETQGLPGIFALAKGDPKVTGSMLQK
jgi:hypothetical protein